MLSKQWKSNLHTPLLPQHNIKSRVKPLNVPISRPEIQEVCCFILFFKMLSNVKEFIGGVKIKFF